MFYDVSNEAVATVLDKSVDAFETYGWIQNDLGDTSQGFCAVGALSFVTDSPHLRFAGYKAIEDVADHSYRDIVGWNNKTDQTKDNVIATFKRAAERVRNLGS